MTRGRGRWARRGVVAGLVGGGVLVVTTALELEPEPVRVLLLTALVVVSASVLSDAIPQEPAVWYPVGARPVLTRGRDSATSAHLRHLENHQATRRPDAAVRERLLGVADRVLQARHGVRADSEQGRALMGPELCEVLEGRIVRLSPRRTDQVLRMIEEL